MRKLIVIVLFFIIFSVPVADAKMMKDRGGNVVETDDSLAELSEEERVAVETGKEVPVNTSKKHKRSSFFHYTPIEEYSEVIVYKDKKLSTIKKSNKIYGEEEFAVHVVVLIIAIAFMAISNLLIYKKMYISGVLVSAVVVVVVSVGVVVASTVVSTSAYTVAFAFELASIAVFLSAAVGVDLFAGADMTKREIQVYEILSIIFYMLAIAVIIFI